MTTVLHTFCLVVGFAILLHKVWGLARGQRADAVAVAFCLYVGLSALSYLVLLPPVYVFVDELTGMPNSAGLCSGMSVLGLTIAQQFLLMHWTYRPADAKRRVRNRFTLAAPIFTGYVVTYFVFEPRQRRFDDFYVQYTHQLAQAPYLVIYILACIIGQVDVVRHCWRYAKISHRGWLRRGMVTTAIGGAVILVYCAVRVADLLAGPLGGDLRPLEPLAWACGDIGSMLALIGWVLPTIGPRLSAARRWLRAQRDYHRLYPLWRALCAEVPVVALDPPTSTWRDFFRLRDIDFWLHRRVVEIQDARRALRRGEDVPTAIAATQARADDRAEVAPADRDLRDEIRWLTEWADEFVAYQRSQR
ncbi:MAB_1171c family putative transporter [Kutzneria sp. CA-103260]|uniref:MAB_1171c family putative transporter n=1 Tax=Kutzneria sp. CA-103260 TaxID=2802641 RepID=UPI001BA7BD3F|nr:MAB_1171c family putative transporter [Kutzneria sp. CA-103260]QUQ66635.1 hypothetical protein JJ691_43630 [Kutzneria sp. CA-103260]